MRMSQYITSNLEENPKERVARRISVAWVSHEYRLSISNRLMRPNLLIYNLLPPNAWVLGKIDGFYKKVCGKCYGCRQYIPTLNLVESKL